MSRQSEAKSAQGYIAKPVQKACANCVNFKFEHVLMHPPTSWRPEGWHADKNMRCGIGGFAVGKTATCSKWAEKEASK